MSDDKPNDQKLDVNKLYDEMDEGRLDKALSTLDKFLGEQAAKESQVKASVQAIEQATDTDDALRRLREPYP